jgi:hypothetical protein
MSEMVERAADALVRQIGYGEQVGERGDAIAAVKVVIAALREPTAAMRRAGLNTGIVATESEASVEEAWRAMIDAALDDG